MMHTSVMYRVCRPVLARLGGFFDNYIIALWALYVNSQPAVNSVIACIYATSALCADVRARPTYSIQSDIKRAVRITSAGRLPLRGVASGVCGLALRARRPSAAAVAHAAAAH